MTIYYVSPTGSDGNAGTSTEQAFATPAAAMAVAGAGDQVLFQRGGRWRGQTTFDASGSDISLLILGAYGDAEDPLPVFDGSELVSGWTNESGSVWYATLAAQPGQVFFDDARGSEVADQLSLAAPLDWWWDDANDRLYVFSETDPAMAWAKVEAATAVQAAGWFANCSWVEVNDLHFYRGWKPACRLSNVQDATFNRCEFSGATEEGLRSAEATNARIDFNGCRFYGNGLITGAEDDNNLSGHGVVVTSGASDHTFTDCEFYENTQDGAQLGQTAGSNHSFVRCHSHHNHFSGFNLKSGSNQLISACLSELNDRYGLMLQYNLDTVTVEDSRFVNNSQDEVISVNTLRIEDNVQLTSRRNYWGPCGGVGWHCDLFTSGTGVVAHFEADVFDNGFDDPPLQFGFHLQAGSATFKNCTFLRQSASEALYGREGLAYLGLFNCLFYTPGYRAVQIEDTTVYEGDHNCFYRTSDSASVFRFNAEVDRDYSRVQVEDGTMFSVEGTDGNSIGSDPLVVGWDTGELDLDPESPCVNAGGSYGVATDINGQPYGAPDIGAHSKQAVALVTPVIRSHSFVRSPGANAQQATVAKPAGTAEGDLVVVSLATDGGETHAAPDASWTQIQHDRDPNGTEVTLSTWYKFAGPSEPESYTFTWGSSEHWAIGAVAIQGVDQAEPVNALTVTNGTSSPSPLVTPGTDTTKIHCLALHLIATSGYELNNTSYPDELWFEETTEGSTTLPVCFGARYEADVPSVGNTGTKDFDADPGFPFVAVTIAFAPSSSAGEQRIFQDDFDRLAQDEPLADDPGDLAWITSGPNVKGAPPVTVSDGHTIVVAEGGDITGTLVKSGQVIRALDPTKGGTVVTGKLTIEGDDNIIYGLTWDCVETRMAIEIRGKRNRIVGCHFVGHYNSVPDPNRTQLSWHGLIDIYEETHGAQDNVIEFNYFEDIRHVPVRVIPAADGRSVVQYNHFRDTAGYDGGYDWYVAVQYGQSEPPESEALSNGIIRGNLCEGIAAVEAISVKSSGVLVEDNYLFHSSSINFRHGHSNTMRGNVLVDCLKSSIVVTGDNHLVEDNVVYCTSAVEWPGEPAIALSSGSKRSTSNPPTWWSATQNNVFRNNDVHVYSGNNACYGWRQYAPEPDTTDNPTNNVIEGGNLQYAQNLYRWSVSNESGLEIPTITGVTTGQNPLPPPTAIPADRYPLVNTPAQPPDRATVYNVAAYQAVAAANNAPNSAGDVTDGRLRIGGTSEYATLNVGDAPVVELAATHIGSLAANVVARPIVRGNAAAPTKGYSLYAAFNTSGDGTIHIEKLPVGNWTGSADWVELTPGGVAVPGLNVGNKRLTLSAENDDLGNVTLTARVDGQVVASVVDDGSLGGAPILSGPWAGMYSHSGSHDWNDFAVVAFGGEAPGDPTTWTWPPTSGGMTWGGEAAVVFTAVEANTYTAPPPSGGINWGGAATTAFVSNAPTTTFPAPTPSGGMTWGGHAEAEFIFVGRTLVDHVGSGGINWGGHAVDQFVEAPDEGDPLDWPAELPQFVLQEGFSETAPPVQLRTQMDSGIDKVRKRFTAVPRVFQATIGVSAAQVEVLDAFWLANAATRFNWVHPRTGVPCQMRFLGPPRYSAFGSEYTATLMLEVMP